MSTDSHFELDSVLFESGEEYRVKIEQNDDVFEDNSNHHTYSDDEHSHDEYEFENEDEEEASHESVIDEENVEEEEDETTFPRNTIIWLENRKSKKQWQETFTEEDICASGPVGIPAKVIMTLLKSAFMLRHEYPHPPTNALQWVNVIELKDRSLSIILTANLSGGVWKPEFNFNIPSKRLKKVDILEAKLRDQIEEIRVLKASVENLQLQQSTTERYSEGKEEEGEKVSSSGGRSISLRASKYPHKIAGDEEGRTAVGWFLPPSIATPPSEHFTQGDDGPTVIVKVEGTYLVNVRLVAATEQSDRMIHLQVNEEDVGTVHCATTGEEVLSHFDHKALQPNTHLTEILQLGENDELRVVCDEGVEVLESEHGNRLSIARLSNLL